MIFFMTFPMLPFAAAHPLVHVNAALNATATVLLVVGYVLIRRRKEQAHKWVMLAAFDVSVAFLICYLWYHFNVGHVKFGGSGAIKIIYLLILLTHIVLAATVPFLALATIYFGFRATGCCEGRCEKTSKKIEGGDIRQQNLARFRRKHRQLARWTFPIWLYVSVTGVIVYLMLYHLWPSAEV